MKINCFIHSPLLALTVFLLLLPGPLCADLTSFSSSSDRDDTLHKLTIFVIPSNRPLDWSSPASLHKTTKKSWVSTVTKKHKYSLGHLFVQIESPLLDGPVLTGMSSVSNFEKLKLYLIEKVGLGIMGATMKGALDSREKLEEVISHTLSKEGRIAFLTFLISKEAAMRVIAFLQTYRDGTGNGPPPSNFYGGAFWPGFEGEGAGCTAFGMALVDACGIDVSREEWFMRVKIPGELVGGRYNNNKRVKNSLVESYKAWHNGEGELNKDFFQIEMYDPCLIYKWITKRYNEHISVTDKFDVNTIENEQYLMAMEMGETPALFAPEHYLSEETTLITNMGEIRGVYIDARQIPVPQEKPLFTRREKPSVFIDIFKKELECGKLFPRSK